MCESNVLSNPQIRFTVADQDIDCDKFQRVLSNFGVLLLELEFVDQEGSIFKQLVQYLGEADSHDSSGTAVWDIKYDARADQATSARSLTTREFDMHTDASFDKTPPKYIGLYVVQQDRLGGGVSQIIDSKRILPLLSDKARRVLLNTEFKIRVPQEFMQGRPFVMASLLDSRGNIRYRRELIVLEECTQDQLAAISELETLLSDASLVESIFLKTGTIMLLDNRRFFHARTEVKDKARHLLRMRFNPKSENSCAIAA